MFKQPSVNKNILILKFPYSSTFGGGEKHTITLVRELTKKHWNFYLVSSCKVLLEEFKNNNWKSKKLWIGKEPVSLGSVIIFPFYAILSLIMLMCVVLYYRIFRRVKTLYCLSFTEKILITPFAKLLGMNVVWMEHVTAGRWLESNPFRFLYVLFAKFVHIVVPSHNTKETYEALGIAENRIKVIYVGIAVEEWSVPSKHLDDPTKVYMLGYVGRLEPEKGVDVLIQAIARVNEVLPQVRCMVIGSGSKKKNLEWLCNNLNLQTKIRFVGFQRNLQNWYEHFHVLILPSVKREALGTVLLEALAAKVPVVGSNLGGVPEIIQHKKTGYLVTPGNVQELADTLLYIYNHYNEALDSARNGSALVAERFSLEYMIQEFESIL